MQILKHFTRTNTPNLIIYRLHDSEWNLFVEKLTNKFRLCYISNDKLLARAADARISPSKFLEKYVLPDEPSIQSGDFGELLSLFAIKENYKNKGLILNAPLKWRWKDNRNKPAPCSDSILFYIADDKKYTEKDLVVTIEAKMKAVKSNKHRIQDAIDGATNDKLSRLSKTLIWLEERYAKKGLIKKREMIERFKDPATYGSFQKQYKAIAIIDKFLETDETSKAVKNNQDIIVIVFSIKELKKAYEETRMNIIRSAQCLLVEN